MLLCFWFVVWWVCFWCWNVVLLSIVSIFLCCWLCFRLVLVWVWIGCGFCCSGRVMGWLCCRWFVVCWVGGRCSSCYWRVWLDCWNIGSWCFFWWWFDCVFSCWGICCWWGIWLRFGWLLVFWRLFCWWVWLVCVVNIGFGWCFVLGDLYWFGCEVWKMFLWWLVFGYCGCCDVLFW